MVSESGAAAIGINFFPGSKRYVDLQTAEKIVEFAGPDLIRVGVTVNADFDTLSSIWNSGLVDMFQFHGTENAEYVKKAAEKGWIFYLAKRIKNREDAIAAIDDASSIKSRIALLDSYVQGEMGGTGQVIDWSQLTGLAHSNESITCILAGGLNPKNVGEAIRAANPHAVDVASGVEDAPGRKSKSLVFSFLKEVQAAAKVA